MKVVLAVSRKRVGAADVATVDPTIEAVEVDDVRGPLDGIEDGEVFVGNPAEARCAEILARMPRLRWFHAPAAGVDRYLAALAERPDVVLTNSRGANALPIAEYTIALILTIVKRLTVARDAQLRRDWQGARAGGELREVAGLTLAIVGMGAIGTELARLASGLGMRVLGVRRSGGTPLHEALAAADLVVLCFPLTPDTQRLIDRTALAAMRPDAWLINVARGEVVDEDALYDALRRRAIAGAALDTLWIEPLPKESRWYELDNVLITPHRAASSTTHNEAMAAIFSENLRRYLAGQPLRNVIDRALGY